MTEPGFTRAEPPRFGIGRALGAGLQIIGRGFVPIVIALVGISAVQFAIIFRLLTDPPAAIAASAVTISWMLVLCNTICDVVFNAFMTGLALSVVEDNRADWRRALSRVPRVALQIGLLSAIYATLGRFGIPGVPTLATMGIVLAIGACTWLYSSVLVREGGNPLSALRRNLQLTQGHRLKIVALLVISIVLYFVVGFGGGFVAGAVFTALGIPVTPTVSLGIQLSVTQLINVFYYVMAASSYHPLATEKDGPRQAALAEVFD